MTQIDYLQMALFFPLEKYSSHLITVKSRSQGRGKVSAEKFLIGYYSGFLEDVKFIGRVLVLIF